MIGPGKYEEQCARVLEETEAQGVLLLIFGGNQGNGAPCKATPEMMKAMPGLLRQIADGMEQDLKILLQEN